MNRFLALVSLLSFVVLSNGQSKTFCQVFKENDGYFGYTLTVPTGTMHKKFYIYKDHYWELEYNPGSDADRNGRLSLMDVNSKQSDWLNSSNGTWFAFAVRSGDPSTPWNETTIGLVDYYLKSVAWSAFPIDMNGFDDQLTNKSTFSVNFTDPNTGISWEPEVAYNSYSRQEAKSTILLRQQQFNTSLPFWSPKIETWKLVDTFPNVTKLDNMTHIQITGPDQFGREIVPMSLWDITTKYRTQYIKGLFGAQVNRNSTLVNGTVVLIACCISEGRQECNGPNSATNCNGTFKYLYCAVGDDDTDVTHCEMNAMSELIDCLSPPTTAPDSNTGADGETVSNNASPTPEESGSMWWLWLLILLILLIIIAVILCLCCCPKREEVVVQKEVIEETVEKTVRSESGLPKSGTGLPKSGTGLPKSETGVPNSRTGEQRGFTGVLKSPVEPNSGTGVPKSGTGASKSGTEVPKRGTGQSGVKATGSRSSLGSLEMSSVRSQEI